MKALVNDCESSYEIIIPAHCDMLDVNNGGSSNVLSITVYRLTIRRLITQQDLLEVQLSTAGANSFLIILIVLIVTFLR